MGVTLSVYGTTIHIIFDSVIVIRRVQYRLQRRLASTFFEILTHHFVALEKRYRTVLE